MERDVEPEMTEWQPIKTAPKNKPVLLYSPMWEMTWGIVVGKWQFAADSWLTSEGEVGPNDPDFDPDAEVDPEEDEDLDSDLNMGPTHWMPLPEPPRAADRSGND